MNRELKFRVWDLHNDTFCLFQDDEDGFEVRLLGSYGALYDCPKAIIQQYTGCKDKNGTPIYEGDILVADHDSGEGEANIGVVYFAAGTYMIDGDGPLYEHVFGHSPDILDNHTVIGNKFENPELLEA